MAYLNLELNYFGHPKTMRLVAILGKQHVAIPLRLWCYVGAHHCEDGSLRGYSVREIESVLMWKGKEGAAVEALVKVRLLDEVVEEGEKFFKVHDWLDHAGHLMAFKKRARESARKRWNKIGKVDAISMPQASDEHASGMPDECLSDAPILANPTNPNQPSLPTGIKEEEKKEDVGAVKTAPTSKSADTWHEYSEAYRRRYGVIPVRNQMTNTHLCKLVDRLGKDDAPRVAAFYLSHNKQFYVQSRHPTNLLLLNAEALRTEWKTGVKSTGLEARSAEQRDAVSEQAKRVRALLEGKA